MLISRIEKYTHDTKFDLIINVNLNLHFLIYFPLFEQNSFDYFITYFIIVLISVSLQPKLYTIYPQILESDIVSVGDYQIKAIALFII